MLHTVKNYGRQSSFGPMLMNYTSVVKVRRTGVEAYLDGQLTTSLKTDYADMDVRGPWRLKRRNVIGIGASDQTVRFDAVEIIEVTGKGTKLAQ